MQINEEKLKLLREENIPSLLIKLGLPTMVGLLVSALYNVVDAFYVGGLGTSQMGAVSVAFPIGQMLIGLGMTFGSGAASYLSRLLGENKRDEADKVASTALFTSMLVGIIAIIISIYFLDNILQALGATNTILPYAHAYGIIFIGGGIFSIFNTTVNHTITAEGASKVTMVAMITGGVLNIILAPVFIYVFKLGVAGAAIATIISQAVTSLIYLSFILEHKGVLRFSIHNFTPNSSDYKEIFKVGIPGFLFQLLTSASMGLINSVAGAYGDMAVAAIGVSIRVMTVGNYVIFGFLRGFQPIVGYNFGAKLYDRLKEAVNTALKWSTAFCVFTAALLFMFAPQVMHAFSKDTTVISIGSVALKANAILFVFYGLQTVFIALFFATGKAKEGALLSFSRQGIFFIPAVFILPKLLGLNGIILSQPMADICTVILTIFLGIKAYGEINSLQKLSHNINPASECI